MLRHSSGGRIVVGTPELRAAFDGPPAVPTMVLADGNGRIVRIWRPANLHAEIERELRTIGLMMLPTLRTERLTLRALSLEDAPAIQEYCSAIEIAANTLSIPHPYPPGAAEEWIAKQENELAKNHFVFAIDDGQLAGTIGLMGKDEGIAELGYWIAKPFWNRGYAAEAAREVVRYGFEERGLRRIFACHFTRNPASGRVLQKAGMTYEGTLRQHLKKWDEYVDLAYYGILREEWS